MPNGKPSGIKTSLAFLFLLDKKAKKLFSHNMTLEAKIKEFIGIKYKAETLMDFVKADRGGKYLRYEDKGFDAKGKKIRKYIYDEKTTSDAKEKHAFKIISKIAYILKAKITGKDSKSAGPELKNAIKESHKKEQIQEKFGVNEVGYVDHLSEYANKEDFYLKKFSGQEQPKPESKAIQPKEDSGKSLSEALEGNQNAKKDSTKQPEAKQPKPKFNIKLLGHIYKMATGKEPIFGSKPESKQTPADVIEQASKDNFETMPEEEKKIKEGFDSIKIYDILPKYSITELQQLDYPELRRIAGLGYRKMDKDLLKKINEAFTPLLKEGNFEYSTKESAIRDIVKYSKDVIESDKNYKPLTDQEYRDIQDYRLGHGSSVMNRDFDPIPEPTPEEKIKESKQKIKELSQIESHPETIKELRESAIEKKLEAYEAIEQAKEEIERQRELKSLEHNITAAEKIGNQEKLSELQDRKTELLNPEKPAVEVLEDFAKESEPENNFETMPESETNKLIDRIIPMVTDDPNLDELPFNRIQDIVERSSSLKEVIENPSIKNDIIKTLFNRLTDPFLKKRMSETYKDLIDYTPEKEQAEETKSIPVDIKNKTEKEQIKDEIKELRNKKNNLIKQRHTDYGTKVGGALSPLSYEIKQVQNRIDELTKDLKKPEQGKSISESLEGNQNAFKGGETENSIQGLSPEDNNPDNILKAITEQAKKDYIEKNPKEQIVSEIPIETYVDNHFDEYNNYKKEYESKEDVVKKIKKGYLQKIEEQAYNGFGLDSKYLSKDSLADIYDKIAYDYNHKLTEEQYNSYYDKFSPSSKNIKDYKFLVDTRSDTPEHIKNQYNEPKPESKQTPADIIEQASKEGVETNKYSGHFTEEELTSKGGKAYKNKVYFNQKQIKDISGIDVGKNSLYYDLKKHQFFASNDSEFESNDFDKILQDIKSKKIDKQETKSDPWESFKNELKIQKEKLKNESQESLENIAKSEETDDPKLEARRSAAEQILESRKVPESKPVTPADVIEQASKDNFDTMPEDTEKQVQDKINILLNNNNQNDQNEYKRLTEKRDSLREEQKKKQEEISNKAQKTKEENKKKYSLTNKIIDYNSVNDIKKNDTVLISSTGLDNKEIVNEIGESTSKFKISKVSDEGVYIVPFGGGKESFIQKNKIKPEDFIKVQMVREERLETLADKVANEAKPESGKDLSEAMEGNQNAFKTGTQIQTPADVIESVAKEGVEQELLNKPQPEGSAIKPEQQDKQLGDAQTQEEKKNEQANNFDTMPETEQKQESMPEQEKQTVSKTKIPLIEVENYQNKLRNVTDSYTDGNTNQERRSDMVKLWEKIKPEMLEKYGKNFAEFKEPWEEIIEKTKEYIDTMGKQGKEIYDNPKERMKIEDFIKDIEKPNNEITSGSEKQINWAEKIKEENMKTIERKYMNNIKASDSIEEAEVEKEKMNVAMKYLNSKKDASFWINNRDRIELELDNHLKLKEKEETMPKKSSFDGGLSGLYTDGVRVEDTTIKDVKNPKAYRFFFPFTKDTVSKVQAAKDKMYKNTDSKTRKEHGKIEFYQNQRGTYWIFPEYYVDDLKNILKDFLHPEQASKEGEKSKSIPKTPADKIEQEAKGEQAKPKKPAFSLTQETRSADASSNPGMFGNKEQVESKYTSKNYKPVVDVSSIKSNGELITKIKDKLIDENLTSKASEFVNKAYKGTNTLDDIKDIASEYVTLPDHKKQEKPKEPEKPNVSIPQTASYNQTMDWLETQKQSAIDSQRKTASDNIKIAREEMKASQKRKESEDKRLEESNNSGNSFNVIPADKLKTKEQYTSKDSFDKPVIEGIKQSILASGYDQSKPITIDQDGYVVDGHHRFTAVQELIKDGKIPKDTPIPTITKTYGNETDRLMDQVSANKMRRQVNPLDDSKAYKKLLDSGKTAQEISERTGESVDKIKNTIALSNLVPELQDLIQKQHMASRKTGKQETGTEEKQKNIRIQDAYIIGTYGLNEDGKPNSTIQMKAFKYANENKPTPSQLQSYIKNLTSQSFSFGNTDSSGRSAAEKEALESAGGEEKAFARTAKVDNFIKDSQKVFSKLFGQGFEADPKLIKELTASVMGTKGKGSAEILYKHMDALIQTLQVAKEQVKRSINEIEGNASMGNMFSMKSDISKDKKEKLKALKELLKDIEKLIKQGEDVKSDYGFNKSKTVSQKIYEYIFS